MLGHVEGGKVALRPMNQVWKALQQSLSKSEKARSYLKDRGLSTKGVGYHSGRLHKSKLVKEAKTVGLINEQNNPWAANCVIYPLKDVLDKVVSLYGRSLETGHFYMFGRSGLYPSYPNKQAKRIILTESIIDAASLLEMKCLKDYEVLALYGTNGFTVEHKKALESCGELEEIILLLDGDAAGQKASKKYQSELQKLLPKVRARIVELPEGTNVNELWANHLSEQITWLHQLQREVDNNGRIITTKEDIRLAINLLLETIILKADELDGSLRQFFEQLKDYVEGQEEKEKYCFGRREIRQALGVRKSQLHNYIRSLVQGLKIKVHCPTFIDFFRR